MTAIDLNNKSILVTGAAGFIGSNLVMRLLSDLQGATIVGIDNMNDYYDVSLKEYRLKELETLHSQLTLNSKLSTLNYHFVKGSISDRPLIDDLFADHHFDIVVNLAAQAGVRYSIDNPDAYIQSNIIGFYNILEACRHSKELVEEYQNKTFNFQLSTFTYIGLQHLADAPDHGKRRRHRRADIYRRGGGREKIRREARQRRRARGKDERAVRKVGARRDAGRGAQSGHGHGLFHL